MPKAMPLFVVYCYDKTHKKQYVCVDRGQAYARDNPRNAFEFRHDKAIEFLARHGKDYGGGCEDKTEAYTEYILKNNIDPATDNG